MNLFERLNEARRVVERCHTEHRSVLPVETHTIDRWLSLNRCRQDATFKVVLYGVEIQRCPSHECHYCDDPDENGESTAGGWAQEKLWPQPQVRLAFGLVIAKPD